MNSERYQLYIEASDLWYRLREDYKSVDDMLIDFYKYLKLEAELAKSLSRDERECIGEYKNTPISHEDKTGKNIAYSILTTIDACSQWLPQNNNVVLNQVLWLTLHIFSHPHMTQYWDEFYLFVENIELTY